MTDQMQSGGGSVPDAAAMVIRVWRETDEATGLRARITQVSDLGGEVETTVVVTSAEAVYDEVRGWLEAFVGRN